MRILSVSSAPPRKQIYNYPHHYFQRLNGCCTFIPYTCTFNSQSARFTIDTLTDNLKRKRLPHKVHRAASSSGPTYNDDIKARALWFDWPDRQQVTSQPIAPSYILISCWSSSHDPPPSLSRHVTTISRLFNWNQFRPTSCHRKCKLMNHFNKFAKTPS